MNIVIGLVIIVTLAVVQWRLIARLEKKREAQRYDVTLAQFEKVYDAYVEGFGDHIGTKLMEAWIVTMEGIGKVIAPTHSKVQSAILFEIGHGPGGYYRTLREIASPDVLALVRFDKKLAETVTAERVVKLEKMLELLEPVVCEHIDLRK
ncbi:MAG: hypothetical protein AAB920_03430 [Patescibacteria group bacterium]